MEHQTARLSENEAEVFLEASPGGFGDEKLCRTSGERGTGLSMLESGTIYTRARARARCSNKTILSPSSFSAGEDARDGSSLALIVRNE